MSRMFSREELAFFAIPRRWVPWIVGRFGDESDVRDAIIHADDDGGLGFLHWVSPEMSWVLSGRGKRWVGNEALARGAKWELPQSRAQILAEIFDGPDTRESVKAIADTAIRVSDRSLVLPTSSAIVKFLCPKCGTKSLGVTRCLECEPPEPENP
jgi:predicted RNA-binding Zn-ribbon protein involved in translation (DUF1610 family)